MKKYNWRPMIRSASRKLWMWSPMRKEAIVNARVPGMKPYHVDCAQCGLRMKESADPKLFDVDHIVPASDPAFAILSWDDFFERLFIPAKEGLWVLCKQCHSVKTESENEGRRKTRSSKIKR